MNWIEAPPRLDFGAGLQGLLQVVEVGCTVTTADGPQVEFDVLGQPGFERFQQEAAKLAACGAAQTHPPQNAEEPDVAPFF